LVSHFENKRGGKNIPLKPSPVKNGTASSATIKPEKKSNHYQAIALSLKGTKMPYE